MAITGTFSDTVYCPFNLCYIGAIYSRGIMPYGQRKKIIEKARLRGRKNKGGDAKGASEIQTGQMVCLHSSPIYHVGAIGFCTVDGIPKVGQLMEASWSLNDIKRFKIKPTARYEFKHTIFFNRPLM